MPLKFEDLHDHDSPSVYYSPNEDPRQWRELLKHIPIHRAAAICSSGEVGLFSILPLVRKDLVLIDHSYRSLSVAMMKYLTLQEYGWTTAYKMFTDPDRKPLIDAFERLKEKLPEKVQGGYRQVNGLSRIRFVSSQGDLSPQQCRIASAPGIQAEWKRTPAKLVAKTCKKLDKVNFVHGDLTDLVDKGPFNLLYLSNALEHVSRTGREPAFDLIEKIVKPGGYIIACGTRHGSSHHGSANTLDTRWEKIKSTKFEQGKEDYMAGSFWHINWDHTLYRVRSKDAEPVLQAVA